MGKWKKEMGNATIDFKDHDFVRKEAEKMNRTEYHIRQDWDKVDLIKSFI